MAERTFVETHTGDTIRVLEARSIDDWIFSQQDVVIWLDMHMCFGPRLGYRCY